MITAVFHHYHRETCDGCGTRVFAFADEIDPVDNISLGRHFCRMCADKEQRGIRSDAWRHA